MRGTAEVVLVSCTIVVFLKVAKIKSRKKGTNCFLFLPFFLSSFFLQSCVFKQNLASC